MKRILISLAIAMMMSVGAMAQAQQKQQGGAEPQRVDTATMAKQRTEQMVKDYGLNEEQAKQLLALNLKYVERMPPRPRASRSGNGQRTSGMQGRMQRMMRPSNDSVQRMPMLGGDSVSRLRRIGGNGNRLGRTGSRMTGADSLQRMAGRMPNLEEMRKRMDSYNAELEKILTAEQYAKYKEDMQKRIERGPRSGQRGGQRSGQRSGRRLTRQSTD